MAARITGDIQRFDIAEMTADAVLSSPYVLPYLDMLTRCGLGLMAVQRGDVAAASEQYAALESMRGISAAGYIVTDRLLGLLSVTMGQLDQAMAHFEDALAFCRKAGYRPELAWTCCDYADALLVGAHGRAPLPPDRQKAMALLDEALRISSELGMRPLMERVLSRRQILTA